MLDDQITYYETEDAYNAGTPAKGVVKLNTYFVSEQGGSNPENMRKVTPSRMQSKGRKGSRPDPLSNKDIDTKSASKS